MCFSLEFRMISLTSFVEYATLKTVAEYYSRLRSEPFIQPIFIDTVWMGMTNLHIRYLLFPDMEA